MREVKAVIFDMGGVLLNLGAMWKGTEWEMSSGLPAGSLSKVITSKELTKKSADLFTGKITAERFDQTVLAETLTEMFDIRIKHEPLRVYSAWVPHRSEDIILYGPMMRALSRLKEAGLRTALLTNNFFIDEERQRPTVHVDTSDFDVVVESCRIGIAKPDERIFKITLERLGVDGENCVFLDDCKQYCDAARKLSITPLQVSETKMEEIVAELERLTHVKLS